MNSSRVVSVMTTIFWFLVTQTEEISCSIYYNLNTQFLLLSFLRLAANDSWFHGHGRGHHPVRLGHRFAGLLLGPRPHAVCGRPPLPNGRWVSETHTHTHTNSRTYAVFSAFMFVEIFLSSFEWFKVYIFLHKLIHGYKPWCFSHFALQWLWCILELQSSPLTCCWH